eukprot:938529-Rhodomonas_salina.1
MTRTFASSGQCVSGTRCYGFASVRFRRAAAGNTADFGTMIRRTQWSFDFGGEAAAATNDYIVHGAEVTWSRADITCSLWLERGGSRMPPFKFKLSLRRGIAGPGHWQ